jgi:hypothetical protein
LEVDILRTLEKLKIVLTHIWAIEGKMSTDSLTYTASYLRGLKAEQHEAKVLRDQLNRVCEIVKASVIENAKRGLTSFQFQCQSYSQIKINTYFVELCFNDIKKAFPDCLIALSSTVGRTGVRDQITIDWSLPAEPSPIQPTLISLQEQINAINARL